MSDARPNLIADRYRLVEPLGQGGMGRVWKARDEVLHRDVAIKELVPPPGLTQDERREMRERSLREARAIARLNHINVVRVFDVLRTDGDPWIVMEYVPSRSLQDTLATDGPVSPNRAAVIGLGVLGALKAAHRAGVMHRDVKPGNVLLGLDGRVVLTDFGLATVPGDPNVTRTGLVLGSPAYIAPERARDGTAGPEADLWSLGATLYAAVEGQSPYARPSAIATLAALATEPPPPAKRAGPLKPVLNGLLRKDPASRIDADVAERLLRRAAGRGSRTGLSLFEGVRRPSPLGPRPERTRIVPLPAQRPPQERQPSPQERPTPRVPPAAETAKLPAAPVSPPTAPPAAETTKLSTPSTSPAAETTKLPTPSTPPAAETTKLPTPSAPPAAETTKLPPPTPAAESAAEPEEPAATTADSPAGTDERDSGRETSKKPESDSGESSAGPAGVSRTKPATRTAERIPPGLGKPGSKRAEADPGVDRANQPRPGIEDLTRRIVAAVPAAMPVITGRARGLTGRARTAAGRARALTGRAGGFTARARVVANRLRPPAGSDDETGRPLLSRTGWLVLALLAVLLLGTAIAVPLLRDNQREDPGAQPGAGVPTAPAASPTAVPSPTALATTTAPATTPPATPATTPPPADGALGPPVVPAGWRLHRDPTGFQVPVPNGWRMTRKQYGRRSDEVRVTFTEPGGRRWLLIDQNNSPKPDPVADWRQQEKARKGRYANYRRVKIEAIDYWDIAADWEWTYSDGGARRTVNRGFVTARDKAYAIRWDTPAEDWDKNLENLQIIADGFRPVRS